MYLKFKSVYIEGFQSIERAQVELDSQGVVLVRGINNFDDNASSNGSGKSSIFQAIYYCIFGKTSEGISDPSNRYYNDGCLVILDFSVDEQDYRIIRSVKHSKYKTAVILYKGSDDISARNKSDTDKMIRTDVMPISQDIFLSTVFLSQGFSGRLSVLNPAGRKERIETLTDTASQVDEFRDKIMDIKNKYSDLYESSRFSYVYKDGTIDSLNRQIDELNKIIEENDKDRPDGNIDDLRKQDDQIEDIITKVRDKQRSINSDISNLKTSINNDLMNSNKLSAENDRIKHDINDLKSGKPCPTCGRPMIDGPVDQSLIDSKLNIIKSNFVKIKEYSSNIESYESKMKELEYTLPKLDENILKLTSKQKNIRDKIALLAKFKDTTDDKKKVYEINNQIEKIQDEMLEIKKSESEYESLRDVAHHCTSLVAKQFRGYLLNETIDFMNSRLLQYSSMLFSNSSDTIKLSVDASKLDIYLGDALYDTLSGGERKKVDIALVLTQRDLALNISGVSCNILILDEIIENCDQVATDAVLGMLSQAAGDIDSMYIISHNNYTVAYDSVITVVKDTSRLSKILIS